MGSRRGEARLHPFQSHRWVTLTCAPEADSMLTSDDQRFRLWFNIFPYIWMLHFFHSFFNIWEKKSNFFIICASKLFLCFLKDYGGRWKYFKYGLIFIFILGGHPQKKKACMFCIFALCTNIFTEKSRKAYASREA